MLPSENIFESLTKFLTSAKSRNPQVHPAVLNGINQTTEGCCCDEKKDSELNGLWLKSQYRLNPEKPAPAGPDAMTVDEARAMGSTPLKRLKNGQD